MPEYFAQIPPPPPYDQRPFQIMFLGRMIRCKGIFDILEMAQKVEARAARTASVGKFAAPGTIWRNSSASQHEMGLESIVRVRGWISLPDLIDVYARSHAAIVPTRSSFIAGLEMTAAEAILAGRPLITSSVVPALELVRPACVEARTDDVDSYVEGVLKLISDREYYEALLSGLPRGWPSHSMTSEQGSDSRAQASGRTPRGSIVVLRCPSNS